MEKKIWKEKRQTMEKRESINLLCCAFVYLALLSLLTVDTIGGDLMTAQHDLVTFELYGILAVKAQGSMGR